VYGAHGSGELVATLQADMNNVRSDIIGDLRQES